MLRTTLELTAVLIPELPACTFSMCLFKFGRLLRTFLQISQEKDASLRVGFTHVISIGVELTEVTEVTNVVEAHSTTEEVLGDGFRVT